MTSPSVTLVSSRSRYRMSSSLQYTLTNLWRLALLVDQLAGQTRVAAHELGERLAHSGRVGGHRRRAVGVRAQKGWEGGLRRPSCQCYKSDPGTRDCGEAGSGAVAEDESAENVPSGPRASRHALMEQHVVATTQQHAIAGIRRTTFEPVDDVVYIAPLLRPPTILELAVPVTPHHRSPESGRDHRLRRPRSSISDRPLMTTRPTVESHRIRSTAALATGPPRR